MTDTLDLKKMIPTCAPAKLLAVSKLQSEAKIRALYDEGQRAFAENYVQEALEKMEHLKDLSEIQWHFIGKLQKNKAKNVVGKFTLIHSVDSLALAETLSQVCEKKSTTQNILIQVNLSSEETKGGFDKQSLKQAWKALSALPHLHIYGFMTMPPLTETGEEVRPYFRELRELRNTLQAETDLKRHPLSELSMGTSHDFKVAIEEGATIVRLGTILFGERLVKR